ncbi:MAG: TraB/GumN family protein [Bacteroidetes bacterium]|nr:TraB/GumN family protein [Bacteroidota bacterium]
MQNNEITKIVLLNDNLRKCAFKTGLMIFNNNFLQETSINLKLPKKQIITFYNFLIRNRNKYWIKKIEKNPNSFVVAGCGHATWGDDSLFNLLKQKGYKITHVLGEETLQKYEKLINESNDYNKINQLCKEAIDIIPYNPYYNALLYKIAADRLETILNLNPKDHLKEIGNQINTNFKKSLEKFNKASKVGYKIEYTKKECNDYILSINKKLSKN